MSVPCALEVIELQVECLTGGGQTDPAGRIEHARSQPPPGELGEALLRLGRVVAPLYESSAMTSVVTTGSDLVLAGDFREGYAIVDRLGTQLVYNSMILGINSRPTGQAGWFAFRRTSGDVVNVDALRLLRR